MELSWKKTSGLFVFGKISHPRTSFPSLSSHVYENQSNIYQFDNFSSLFREEGQHHESRELRVRQPGQLQARGARTGHQRQHAALPSGDQTIIQTGLGHALLFLGLDLMIMLLGDRRHAHGHALWPLALLGDWAQRQRGLGQSSVSQSLQWVAPTWRGFFLVPTGAQGVLMFVPLVGSILLWLSIFMFLVQIFKKSSRWL